MFDSNASRIGVLLVNVGTPEGTSFREVRRYLREFLWDRRVVEFFRPVWWLVLNAIVLNTRPQRSGKAYARIWNQQLDESPLKTITRSQCRQVANAFCDHPEISVDWAMRYGQPSLEQKILHLLDKGCDRILLFPLYPQYTASTTGTVQDKGFEVLKKLRHQPALRTVPAFPEHPLYIRAVSESLQKHLADLEWEPDLVLASFHGLPKSYIDAGDPYLQHCHRTVQGIVHQLAWTPIEFKLCTSLDLGGVNGYNPMQMKPCAG